MFCLFSPSKCANILQLCAEEKGKPSDDVQINLEVEMHSSETVQPVGPGLLQQLGRLIIRAQTNTPSPKLPKQKHKPSTSQQVLIQTQPKPDEEDARLEVNLSNHVNGLWTEQTPVCVEILLGPTCSECFAAMSREESSYPNSGLLLERWTIRAVLDKSESPSVISSPWLLNAVRSQLHFSQLSAWRARLQPRTQERRRKLSRECNIKKLEANCEDENRKLNIVYSIKTADHKLTEFAKPPTDHTFPLTDIGNNKYLKVVLESLPRIDDIPDVKCACQKRRSSKDFTNTEDLVGRLNDLSIGSRKYDGAINSNIGTPTRRLSIISNPGSTEYLYTVDKEVVDDRMHTPCSENGKHKCNCDDESDGKDKNQAKKLDERRLKEIAKYKRRIRKEKVRKFCDSTSSEGEVKKETTSIPILQASRFDRFRAIGCYRNQTYLTLPASRIETKSPFTETDSLYPPDFKKTNTIGTQTDFTCPCGSTLEMTCEKCVRGMVRSEGNYNLASLSSQENGARRKLDDDDEDKSLKKHKCDNISVNSYNDGIIKRPKLRRFFPIVDKLEKIVIERNHNTEKDILDLHLKTDDSVFSTPKVQNDSKLKYLDQNYSKRCNDDSTSCTYDSKRYNDVSTSYTYDSKRYNDDSKSYTNDSISYTGDSKSLHQQTNDSQKYIDDSKSYTGDSKSLLASDSNRYPNGSKSLQKANDKFPMTKESKRQKTYSISDDDYVLYEKCDYGTIDTHEVESPNEEKSDFKFSIPEKNELNGQEQIESLKDEFVFPDPKRDNIPSPSEMDRFRWRFDSAASMVFHTKTGLPLTSSPAPLRRGNNCFDFDDSINGISGIKSALFHPISPVSPVPPVSPASPVPAPRTPPPKKEGTLRMGPSTGLLGSFEESALQGRLEAVATVHGFTAELGASGAFCPPHKRLPVTVFFYAPGGTAAPYMGHINLGPGGYRVARSGTIQVSLFNPHGTLVKMFVVLYDLTRMPAAARTFLRQRTLYMPCGAAPPQDHTRYLRYLIHLRFLTSKTGKLYLHTDIRLIVSRKADLDTAAAHSALLRPPPVRPPIADTEEKEKDRTPIRVFGGSSEHDSESSPEIGYDSSSVSYELRSFTFAPDNPRYSPR